MQKVTGDLSFQAVSHSAAFSEESLHQSTRRNCVSRRTPTRLVAMLHTVRYMLIDNDFVHVYSFDFSKAFHTVRHAPLTSKLAQLELPDSIYWAVDFLDNHAHCIH